jgi:hypothetical protein
MARALQARVIHKVELKRFEIDIERPPQEGIFLLSKRSGAAQ